MRDEKLLPILIAIFMVFALVSLIPPTFARPCPATDRCNRYCSGAVADELGCDYAAVHDLHGGTANDLEGLLTEHLLAHSSRVEASAASGLFSPDTPTAANDTVSATTLPPRPDCSCTTTDAHHLNVDSVRVPVFSNHSDLASLPGWYWCAAYDNYAPSGMPDFDQRQQDDWRNPDSQRFSFCGPTAVANCFWWLDSKYADPAGLPGDGNDTFPLVRDYGGATSPLPGPNWDDHNYTNVNDLATQWPPEGPPPATTSFVPGPQSQPSDMPAWGELIERLAWYVDTDGIRTGRNGSGTGAASLRLGIAQWLEEEGLDGMLGVTLSYRPRFQLIAEQVERGDCVVLNIGVWCGEASDWSRVYGHYVTVAGVNADERLIAISDPGYDQTPPTNYREHSDAAIVSHDIWSVDLYPPRREAGTWWLPDYSRDKSCYAIIERAVSIFEVPITVDTRTASAIGTTSVNLNMSYTLGVRSTVDVRFAYRKAGMVAWAETPWVPVFEGGTRVQTLTGLISNTAYEFKAELRYDETVIEGEVLTFTTEKIAPTVTTQEAADLSTDSATLEMVFAVGDYSPVEVRFKWREPGTDLWSETAWTPQESDGMHVEVLSKLDPDTVYEFKAQLTYDQPPLVIEGGVSGFTTRAKGRCFIATAAYGTPMAEEVQILREFRDGYLLASLVGKSFVDFYYSVSPPIAEFIDQHPHLKPIVRTGLVPAVTVSTIIVNDTPSEKAGIAGLVVLVSVTLAVWAARRRGQTAQYT